MKIMVFKTYKEAEAESKGRKYAITKVAVAGYWGGFTVAEFYVLRLDKRRKLTEKLRAEILGELGKSNIGLFEVN